MSWVYWYKKFLTSSGVSERLQKLKIAVILSSDTVFEPSPNLAFKWLVNSAILAISIQGNLECFKKLTKMRGNQDIFWLKDVLRQKLSNNLCKYQSYSIVILIIV